MPDPNAVTANPQTQLGKKVKRKYGKVNRKAGSVRKGQRYKTVVKKGDTTHVYADGTVVGKGVGKGTKRPPKKRGKAKGSTPSSYDPFAPLDARGLRRETNARTRLEFGDSERQLDKERRVSDQNQTNTTSWFANYQKTLAQAQQVQSQQAQQLQQQIGQQAQQGYNNDIQGQQQLQSQQQAGATQRGVAANPAVIQAGQQAAAARQSQQGALGAMEGIIGQNAANYMGAQRMSAGQRELQAHEKETNRRGEIEQAARDLLKKKGDYKTKTRADILDREHTKQLEDKAYGLDVVQEANDAAQAAADDKQTRKRDRQVEADRKADNARSDRTENRLEQAERWKENHPNQPSSKNPYSGPTPAKRQENKTKFSNGYAIAVKHKKKGFNWLYNSMVEKNYDPLMAQVIALRATGKYPSRKMAKKLRQRFGIGVKSRKWPE